MRTSRAPAQDYADAMFNLALLLQRKGAYAEAVEGRFIRQCLP